MKKLLLASYGEDRGPTGNVAIVTSEQAEQEFRNKLQDHLDEPLIAGLINELDFGIEEVYFSPVLNEFEFSITVIDLDDPLAVQVMANQTITI